MKKWFMLVLLFMGVFHYVMPAFAGRGSVAADVMEAVVKRCKPCRELISSPASQKLITKGIIKTGNADDVAKFLSRYGDDGLKYLDDFGDDALKIFKMHGDEGITYLKKYGRNYIRLIQRESPETIHKILRHPKGMIFLKETPDLAKHYTKYGDELLTCLGKNPLCLESIKRTGLSPKVISTLKDRNITWAEVKMPQLSPSDAKAFQNIITKYGDPAIDFVKRHQSVFFKVGVFAIAAANFDEILNGGVDVLKKTVETGGEVAKESTKETIKTLGSPYLFILIFCVFAMLLVFLTFTLKRSSKKRHE